MGRVRRPMVPHGAIRTFFDRLHALHSAAGQPSMRELQRRTRSHQRPNGINPTTIHEALAGPRLARWDTVHALVDEFATLWREGRAAELQPDQPVVHTGRFPRRCRRTSHRSSDESTPRRSCASCWNQSSQPGSRRSAGQPVSARPRRPCTGRIGSRTVSPTGTSTSTCVATTPQPPMPQREALAALLAGREMLIVLDNAADTDHIRDRRGAGQFVPCGQSDGPGS
jgi:hypothetical protein